MSSTAGRTVKRIARTRGAAAALVTAAGLAVFAVVLQTLSALISFLGAAGSSGLSFDVGASIVSTLVAGLLTFLVFALGYFCSLWFIGPISERLGIAHVITRSVLAVGVGSSLWLVIGGVVALVTTVSFGGGLLGFAFPGLVGLADVPFALLQVLQSALQLFLQLLAPGVLAGILLWRWRTAHPPEYHVEGLVDV